MGKKDTPISYFLEGAGELPYRDLIQDQIKRLSTSRLMQACNGEISLLPSDFQPQVMEYIDEINHHFGYDQQFWQRSTCRDAVVAIINVAVCFFSIEDRISTFDDALLPENQQLTFGLFQIATLTFAYSASTQKSQRKFMGIRKGLFG